MTIERPIRAADPAVSVVVPTIPTNDSEGIVSSLKRQTNTRFEVVIVNDSEIGVCEARNLGLEAAEADIVAFTDDDCLPPPDWIENIVSAFEDEDLVIVEGPVTGGLPYNGRRKYPTCNVAVRRDIALEVGGFRSEYEYWREDTEFGWRMEQMGGYAFDESVEMCHPDSSRSEIKEENERRLQQEYPDRYDEIIIPDTYLGRVNDWLWRRGVWDAIDRFRF